MAAKTKRLGRGLNTLLTDPSGSVLDEKLDIGQHKRRQAVVLQVPVHLLRPCPDQPRRSMTPEGIQSLAKSIEASGIIQPVVARPIPSEESQGSVEYELIAGERRWRAAQMAGLSDLPVIVREDVDDGKLLELALVENLQRENLNAIDRARAYQRLGQQAGLSAAEIGARVGEDRSTVANYLRLLELPSEVQDMLIGGLIGMGHARALLSAEDVEFQIALAARIVRESLSVRTVEDLLRTHRGGHRVSQKQQRPKRPLIRDLERKFADALHTKVKIVESARKNTGRIHIEYKSLEDFDRICALLGVDQSV